MTEKRIRYRQGAHNHAPWLCLLIPLALLLAGCETLPEFQSLWRTDAAPRHSAAAPGNTANPPVEARTTALPAAPATLRAGGARASSPAASGFARKGSGVFLRQPRAAKAAPSKGGDITLNFENTNLLEVIKVILGDLLEKNYTIDPRVRGGVTLQTSRPIPRDALIPTLEMLLRMNGAALVQRGKLYQVVPRQVATRGLVTPQLGGASKSVPRGFGIRIVPLRYIGAEEMKKILDPLSAQGSVIRADSARNLLILAGTSAEVTQMLATVRVFDVDWLAGTSVALFTPSHAEAKPLAEQFRKLFGKDSKSPLAGLVRLLPVKSLNAILVITPRPEYLDRTLEWLGRLDRDSGGAGRRLYVYHVQNGKAADLAEVLGKVFEGDKSQPPPPAAALAPGLRPAVVAGQPPKQGASPPKASQAPAATRGADQGLTISENITVRIIADEINNSLLFMATPEEFRQVRAALRKLDIVPLQVLVEATIAEISLSGDLKYGFEWFFTNKLGNKKGTATLDLDTTAGLATVLPGFSYALTDRAGAVRAVINTLASQSRANIISSPSLMVLNNQKASIQVGDQVPVTTQQQQATTTTSNVINNIEFRDTGVLLNVTPRVNPGGLVTMEVQQEVSNVAPGTATGSLTPTIQTRKISSTVAVQSGQTVVLGGLIRENKNQSKSGLPWLYSLPVLGPLFGSTRNEHRRTELVVLITPRAVNNARDAEAVTNEFRRKMKSLQPFQR